MSCTLCDLPLPEGPHTDPSVEGAYCCRGCLEVARTLEDPAAAAPEDAAPGGPAPAEAPGETAHFRVAGMHCTACEAFLEDVADDAEGVTAARASYASGTLAVSHDADAVDAAALPDRLSGAGYRVRPAAEGRPDDDRPVGRLLVGGFFAMMVMMWYVVFLYPGYLGLAPALQFADLSGTVGTYLLANIWVMATIVLGYTGAPLLRGAYVSLRTGRPNMDLLVVLAASTAYAYSALTVLTGGTEVYFDVTVVVVMAVSLGGYYESRVRERATAELTDLATERATEATVLADGAATDGGAIASGGTPPAADFPADRALPADPPTETVAVDDLAASDRVLVAAGERVPVDGTVVAGTAGVDNSLVTGESAPERVDPGAEVVGGAAVVDGRVLLAPDLDGPRTVDRLLGTLWSVRSDRAGAARLADRLAAVFVPLVVVLAALAGAAHLALGATTTGALLTALAVLVVSCPCALGLATPLAVAAGLRDGLRSGVVVTAADAFERAPDADVVALDKTGTLTTGAMAVRDVVAVDGADPETVLARAAAVEGGADHPVADAVVERARAAGVDIPAVADVETRPGRGVGGTLAGDDAGAKDADGDDGTAVLVGARDLFDAEGWTVPDALTERYATARAAGDVPALVGWGGTARGVLVAGDDPREGWREAVERLAVDREVVVVSGDDPAAVERFGDHPAVDDVFAGVPPDGKTAVVERLRATGTVAMVGDGSNDAPALAAADVGIAMGGGTALAGDAADVVVTDDDLAAVPGAFDLLAGTRRRTRENVAWALLYNAVALPTAALGLLNPLIAAVAMSASSLLVVSNSARPVAEDDG
jgi:Cu2+-exporting ATPase